MLRYNAIWPVPTDDFKWASMQRRGKPSFRNKVSDPERATRNLFERDQMLAAHVKEEAQRNDLCLLEVDGSASLDEIAALVERRFGLASGISKNALA